MQRLWDLTFSVGDHGIYPTAMTSSSDVAADIGCHCVTQRKRKVLSLAILKTNSTKKVNANSV